MPLPALVGIPVLIIAILGGVVAYERHSERSDERKRADNLKRWLEAQAPESEPIAR